VVRAIVASPLPVVCGVGHETDVTLADLAADLRAPTPTAAAELAAPVAAEWLAALDALAARRQRAVQRVLDGAAQRLDTLSLRLGQPGRLLLARGAHLDALGQRLALALGPALARGHERVALARLRLGQAMALALQRRVGALSAVAGRLEALDPAQVLQRGYAWVEDADGRPVLGVSALHPGQAVRAVWADGRAVARIENVEPGAARDGAAPAGHRRPSGPPCQ
jgi:exodeoxyribonuclease VII large subunit